MTGYELMDLRRSYAAEVNSILKFWVSMTFAVVVAAHVAGPEMGIAGAIAVTALYSAMTAVNAFSITRFYRIVSNTTADIIALAEKMEDAPLSLSGVSRPAGVNIALIGIQCLGFLGTITYVLLRGGYIG